MIRSLPSAFLVACVSLMGPVAFAHDETVSASSVRVTGSALSWTVDLGLEGLEKAKVLAVPLDRITEADLAASRKAIADYVRQGLSISLDGQTVQPQIGAFEPRYEPSATGTPALSRVAIELRYTGFRPIESFSAKLAFYAELTRQHRAVVTIRWDETDKGAAVVQQHVRLGVSELTLTRPTATTAASASGGFVLWGMEHIFIGYDHIAFLIVLLLAATRLRDVFLIVTAFTVAHSLTLFLAALEVVRVPSRLTEAVIAASIVYVAVQNLLDSRAGSHGGAPQGRRHVGLAFGFGLVHGLGFASVLAERLESAAVGVLWPVLSFNLGVELGQLAIVALVFPFLGWARHGRSDEIKIARQRSLLRIGSVPLLLAGLVWLGDRLLR